MSRTLLYYGPHIQLVEVRAQLLQLVSLILFYGCRLSNFFHEEDLEKSLILKTPDHFNRPLANTKFLPHLYHLLREYRDPRLAARIAQLLYSAGCPFSVPLPTVPFFSEDTQTPAEQSASNGRAILRDLAARIEAEGNAAVALQGDEEQTVWLLG